ncbi:two-component system chemotaxis response regulator CheB [Clostridium tetanomorphum]|uniref:Protein-glutamate methylesterase/protein-glutamine glutaminase n=1 Tax=Clostridium tetanomorphum TaxID=1553 RepID=A0A923J160_CLOTT|nr:chemotaxis response regulator protein-glutamate methylesterase [Clostridium tetanomorphum]KAJ49001.1 chemotaxis-specific protein-glutamate methyltransferase [Clostridium tetanomorphum DSM 665]KAJ49535.1 chemotaxis-specific protein-glutamate methyltransferase [Clostridium tetanomorphum DSM 665]MBC2398951.1 chemotaxis response regulator protein-glutamate methylesterase [Clostridium tetanomorphum]MBP1866366.1 two-component system chemotaxis response regulator CheB [Clostridium tetanomorphum]NR
MNKPKQIKVLIVDDSLVFRKILEMGISSEPSIQVVATAIDPFDARDKIISFKPDVIICDVQMPKMNGIEFIKRLLPQYPIPILVISSRSEAVFDAMNAGAVDFITKPTVEEAKGVKEFIHEIIEKIQIAANAKILVKKSIKLNNKIEHKSFNSNKDIIAIGASTGGTEAIFNVLKSLSPDVPGIVIVQHIPPIFSRMFADRLNKFTNLSAKEAKSGDYLDTGKVLVAPGDQHMKIVKVNNKYRVECFKGDKVNGHCPSIDLLFNSVAKEAKDKAIGIILTGMGYDGAKGLLEMRRKGATTIGQDETSSVVYGMPKVAFNIGAVERQVSLDNISNTIYSILGNKNVERG